MLERVVQDRDGKVAGFGPVGRGPLGVSVDDGDGATLGRQFGGQVDGYGGLPAAALAANDAYDSHAKPVLVRATVRDHMPARRYGANTL